jgi:hydrogenase expression/formation protein HypC
MCLAVPGQIIQINEDRAKVTINGVLYDAGIALMDNLCVDDWVLMHAGFIIEKLNIEEAEKDLEAIKNYTNLIE